MTLFVPNMFFFPPIMGNARAMICSIDDYPSARLSGLIFGFVIRTHTKLGGASLSSTLKQVRDVSMLCSQRASAAQAADHRCQSSHNIRRLSVHFHSTRCSCAHL